MRKERPKPSRKMNPVILVFCEGETEEAYVNLLKRNYKLPTVRIISRVTGLQISSNIINKYIEAEQIIKNDKIQSFLLYDLDVAGIDEKIAACKNSVSLASNPSLELWFLLHMKEQRAAISTNDCIEKLKKSAPDWASYKKGSFSDKQKQLLFDNRESASARAKGLSERENPSSLVYKFLEALDMFAQST
jgi:hypothetical protein